MSVGQGMAVPKAIGQAKTVPDMLVGQGMTAKSFFAMVAGYVKINGSLCYKVLEANCRLNYHNKLTIHMKI